VTKTGLLWKLLERKETWVYLVVEEDHMPFIDLPELVDQAPYIGKPEVLAQEELEAKKQEFLLLPPGERQQHVNAMEAVMGSFVPCDLSLYNIYSQMSESEFCTSHIAAMASLTPEHVGEGLLMAFMTSEGAETYRAFLIENRDMRPSQLHVIKLQLPALFDMTPELEQVTKDEHGHSFRIDLVEVDGDKIIVSDTIWSRAAPKN
jgi:hypothetical protein